MPYNVSFISLGCAKNQVNCEQMMATVQHAGHNVVLSPEGADVAVVNTCGFLASACEEAIDNILEMAELKKEGKLKKIIVTGCMAQRYKDDVLHELPEVDAVLGTGSYGEIARAVDEVMAPGGLRPCYMGDIQNCVQGGARILSTPSWYAYLRIAEGCDNCCSYCIIPQLRGPYTSRPYDEVMAEARSLAAHGVKELIVVAQDTTRYGEDLTGKLLLPQLLRDLNELEGIKWIRVMYLYPNNFTDDLIAAFAECDKVCKYIDIPLQHASDRLLDSMNRYDTRAQVEELLAKLRERIPGITIRTTFIVGFPGETDEDFAELMDFVEKQRFENAGVFQYSQEDGTVAGAMENQIEPEVKENRYHELMALQAGISEEIHQEREDEELDVIVEGFDEENPALAVGRSYHEAPDIDGNIFIENAAELEVGQMVRVRILQGFTYEMVAELV